MKHALKYIPLGLLTSTVILFSAQSSQAHRGNATSQPTASLIGVTTKIQHKRTCLNLKKHNKAMLVHRAKAHCRSAHGRGKPRGYSFRRYETGCKTEGAKGSFFKVKLRGILFFRCR